NELRSEHERKDELILQMGSDNNVLVKEAVRILRLKGWIEDGTLRGANLMHANLQGAHLRDADLQEACLDFAKLEGANLYRADLRSATLVIASLAGAALKDAKLDGAMLFHTNLKGAKLVTRDQLRQAMILYATLPDGRLVPAHDARVLPYTGLQVHIDESTDGRPRFMPQVLVLAGGERVPIEDYVRPGFDEWCRTVAIDKDGFIVPAPLDESDE